jgi:hypothetical protein
MLQVDGKAMGQQSHGGAFFRNPPGSCMMGYEAQFQNRCEGNDPARPAVCAPPA